ncbi:hypothetical protein ABZ383_00165 [Streptomyces sp. NPDC005900]|uniref:hypothetical protein n=1 Tax=Streptomyces sp. NPDC005900 TaxID=3154569 RepID=UPI0033C58EC7
MANPYLGRVAAWRNKRDVVARARRQSIGSYANSRYSFTRLVEKVDADAKPGQNPIFSSAFQFPDFLPPADQTSQLDLCLCGKPARDDLSLRFNYSSWRLAQSELGESRADSSLFCKRF